MSSKDVMVVEIKNIEKHPNADLLSVFDIEGFKTVDRTDLWKVGDKALYLLPDAVVDITNPLFKDLTLKKGHRVAAKNIRGVNSYGLLIKAPEDCKVGEDVSEKFNITHWNPPEECDINVPKKYADKVKHFSTSVKNPDGYVFSKYDIDNFQKFGREMFKEGESVFITEKIHGENIRFYYQDGQMYVGSRSSWKREFPKVIDPTGIPADVLERLSKFRNRFWEVLTPEIERFCKECRGYTLFGEKYGHNKNFNYDASKEKPKFLAFDIYDHNDNEWLCPASTLHICKFYNIPHVPVLYTHKPFNYDEVMAMCDGESLVENSKNIREGIVIKGDIYSDLHHRRVLKLVSAEFHNRK